MADIGFIAMVMALAVAMYGVIVPHMGVRQNNWNLIRSAQYATIFNFLLVSLATGILVHAFVISDFRFQYVWANSSTDMPIFYKVTGFWGALDGSLLLWALVQSGFSMIVAFRYQHTNRELIPYVIAVLNMIMAFLLCLLVIWSNPFAVQAVVPAEGRGLNPLLQNPGMIAHPPSLYLGYIGFSVPFAFAMAGLIHGKLDSQWILTTRRWTLLSWYFLTLGLILGGQWAYEELGWGGYWAWDPVENAAFMPWLTGTAFLHSVMVQEKRDMLKIWNIVLIIMTFGLSILGTFLTRSGVVNSVHSFTQSQIGPFFLIFLAVVLLFSFTLLFLRVRQLESDHRLESVFCRENAFIAQNVMFVGVAFTVLLGTTFPLLAEAIQGTKLSIQAPFFNTITAPMGYIIFFLMGVGTLIAWRRASIENLKKNFLFPAVAATVGTAGIAFVIPFNPEALLIIWIAMFVTMTVLIELFKATRIKSLQLSTNFLMGFIYVILRNTRRYGGLIIHMGVVLMFIGFAGRLFDIEKDITMEMDIPVTVGKYDLVFQGIEEFPVRNAVHRAAIIEVYQDGKMLEVMKPARSFYPTQPDPLTEVAIRRSFWEDLYLVIHSEAPDGKSATIKIHINPLVGWAWMSLPFFTLGVGISMMYRPKRLVAKSPILEGKYIPESSSPT
ncbi:MAG: heme lyase CcmF/NrfE family subunit [SAR324 cluster bacterium]|nr:heme lyase CcmF/NrfE family subunit [SAR324 cluster bacterium]